MKKPILFFISFFLLNTFCMGQNEIMLTINHKLGDLEFGNQVLAKNNLDIEFKVDRMEYYISQIEITHDGGQKTLVEDFWILVNSTRYLNKNLGTYPIEIVEGISFYIGVEEPFNHKDPTNYPNAHPLAPKNPSMHWGWASGYRFAAMEGYSGAALNQNFQLHGLGDDKYYQTQVEVNATAIDNKIQIILDADYTKALENIDTSTGIIEHGGIAEAHELLKNLRDYVFSPSIITSVNDFEELNQFDVFPNPVIDGEVNIAIQTLTDVDYDLLITNILGQPIQEVIKLKGTDNLSIYLENTGVYFLQMIKDGQAVIAKKVIVQ